MNDNKIYTEEQLRNSMLSMKTYINMYDESVIDRIIENHIKALGEFKLPSDEEIENGYEPKTMYDLGYLDGAKWMRNKIQGGNK